MASRPTAAGAICMTRRKACMCMHARAWMHVHARMCMNACARTHACACMHITLTCSWKAGMTESRIIEAYHGKGSYRRGHPACRTRVRVRVWEWVRGEG